MKLESLRVENLLGCNYNINFDPRYTVIIGNNRQGKTLTARLIMLALYGTGAKERELHESWKLRPNELLPATASKGLVELVIEKSGRRYRVTREFGVKSRVEVCAFKDGVWGVPIAKKEGDVKAVLEEEADITPGLMNVVMSNEQSLIGAISYDEKLQASVWEGWKWRTEMIKGNIKRARDTCGKHASKALDEIDELKKGISSTMNQWVDKGIFTKAEAENGVDEKDLAARKQSIEIDFDKSKEKFERYSKIHQDIIRLDNMDSKQTIEDLMKACDQFKDCIDEKDELKGLMGMGKEYLSAFGEVLSRGGVDGVNDSLRDIEDEIKKLNNALTLTKRSQLPIKAECLVFPPEGSEKLCVQIPDDVSNKFKNEELAGAGVAVPYDAKMLEALKTKKEQLKGLLALFDKKRSDFKQCRDGLRESVGKKKEELGITITNLNGQKIALESTYDKYISDLRAKTEKESLMQKLESAKKIFSRIHDTLSEEDTISKIRKKTVIFINRIFESYQWDINAVLTDDEAIMITDLNGRIRSHPSGSETHVLGLAWRWMVARAFDLPLVLDELDALLDEKNYDRTRKLIEEEMDRQTVILTLRDSLKDLPGAVYYMVREGGASTVNDVT